MLHVDSLLPTIAIYHSLCHITTAHHCNTSLTVSHVDPLLPTIAVYSLCHMWSHVEPRLLCTEGRTALLCTLGNQGSSTCTCRHGNVSHSYVLLGRSLRLHQTVVIPFIFPYTPLGHHTLPPHFPLPSPPSSSFPFPLSYSLSPFFLSPFPLPVPLSPSSFPFPSSFPLPPPCSPLPILIPRFLSFFPSTPHPPSLFFFTTMSHCWQTGHFLTTSLNLGGSGDDRDSSRQYVLRVWTKQTDVWIYHLLSSAAVLQNTLIRPPPVYEPAQHV